MIQFIIIFTDTSYLDIFFNIDDRCKLISGQIFYIRQRDIPTKRNQFHLFQIRYNERQKEEPVEAVLIQIDIFKLLNSIRRNQVSSTSNGGCGCRLRDHARQSGTHEQTPQGCRPIFRVIADGNCPGMKSMLADFSQEKGKRDLIVFVCACSLPFPPSFNDPRGVSFRDTLPPDSLDETEHCHRSNGDSEITTRIQRLQEIEATVSQ